MAQTVYTNAVAITPNDTTVIGPFTAFMVNGAGNIVVTLLGGQDLTITAVAVNTIYPFKITKVKATGTTATGISGLT